MKKNVLVPCLVVGLLLFSACGPISINSGDETISIPEPTPVNLQDQASNNDAAQPGGTDSYKQPKMIVVDSGDEVGLTFYNLQGQAVTELRTPNAGYLTESGVHIAGAVPDGQIMTPLVYHSFNPDSLQMNVNDSITTLVNTPMFYGLAGAVGEEFIAYSTYQPEDNAVTSMLYMGDLNTLPTIGPIYTLENSDNFYVINPMGISTDAGVATGIWYTLSAWGIGGDIIYPVNQGLYYFDMTSGTSFQFAGAECNPQGLSQDFAWVACRGGNPDSGYGYFIKNTAANTAVDFPLDQASDRGAGYGVFSPDNSYIAWMEASGSHMAEVPNYHSRIRIGLTGGGVVFDQDDSAFAQALGTSSVEYIEPIGWIDPQTLLVEVVAQDYGNTNIVKVDITNGSITPFIPGRFIAFAYP